MSILPRLIIIFSIVVSACAFERAVKSKYDLQYQGVAPEARVLNDEFMKLAKDSGIAFKHEVAIGFKKIDQGAIVGLCTYGAGGRRIDLDFDFWAQHPESHIAVLFHELTHCYCHRGHDYGKGINYPPTENERIAQAKEWVKSGGERPGRYGDGCPTSIMFPVVVDRECINAHYGDYVQEMFNRCEAY